jgi:hypothetical protein
VDLGCTMLLHSDTSPSNYVKQNENIRVKEIGERTPEIQKLVEEQGAKHLIPRMTLKDLRLLNLF